MRLKNMYTAPSNIDIDHTVTTNNHSGSEKNKYKQIIQDLFLKADIQINGDRPWDIHVKNEDFYKRLIRDGQLGLGESYMEGWWECDRIDLMIEKITKAEEGNRLDKSLSLVVPVLKAKIFNEGAWSRRFVIGERHYDHGNDLYKVMLDKRMVYSCGYWKDAKSLDEAQEAKLDLICRKLDLKAGQKVLDIGCGWGCFLKYAAEKYGTEGVGITVSKEQVKLGKEHCRGLPIEIKLQDYRELDGKYDRIVSIGMIEHVLHKNYRTYMEIVHRCIKEDGLFLLQTIGSRDKPINVKDIPWIIKYIFPVGEIPSIKQIASAAEGLFVMEDWHNFGLDYYKTLKAWFKNFTSNWDKIKNNYGETFFRMWSFYLLSAAGRFLARKNQLWQIVFSTRGVPEGYKSIR